MASLDGNEGGLFIYFIALLKRPNQSATVSRNQHIQLMKGCTTGHYLMIFFNVKKQAQMEPNFIQRFTSANQDHYHYENGTRDN